MPNFALNLLVFSASFADWDFEAKSENKTEFLWKIAPRFTKFRLNPPLETTKFYLLFEKPTKIILETSPTAHTFSTSPNFFGHMLKVVCSHKLKTLNINLYTFFVYLLMNSTGNTRDKTYSFFFSSLFRLEWLPNCHSCRFDHHRSTHFIHRFCDCHRVSYCSFLPQVQTSMRTFPYFRFGCRILWQKYKREYDSGSVLLGECNSEIQPAKLVEQGGPLDVSWSG